MLYSIPYFLFLLFLLLLFAVEVRCIRQQRGIKAVRYLTVIGFLFFVGLRGHLLTDFINYYRFFQDLPTIYGSQWVEGLQSLGYEIGFTVYSSMIKSIWNNYFFWVFVNTFIDILILNSLAKRYSPYYTLVFILFFVFGGFEMEINLFRNMKSVMLFLLSIKYLQERKFIFYLFLNVVGMMFHWSAVLYLPLYFVLNKAFSQKLMWTILIIGVIIFITKLPYIKIIISPFIDFFSEEVQLKLNKYLFNKEWNVSYRFSLGFFERITSFILVIANYNRIIKMDVRQKVFLNCFVLYFIMFFFFSELSVVSTRLAILFIPAYWFMYPMLYKSFSTRISKQLLLIPLLCFCFLKTSKLNSLLFRYDNLLWGIEGYELRKEKTLKTLEEQRKD